MCGPIKRSMVVVSRTDGGEILIASSKVDILSIDGEESPLLDLGVRSNPSLLSLKVDIQKVLDVVLRLCKCGVSGWNATFDLNIHCGILPDVSGGLETFMG